MTSERLIERIIGLVEAQLDGLASDEQIAELERLIAEDDAARAIYLEYMRDSVLLSEAVSPPSGAVPPLPQGSDGAPDHGLHGASDCLDAPRSIVEEPAASRPRLGFWSPERWLEAAPVVMFGCLALVIGIIAGARFFSATAPPAEDPQLVAPRPLAPATSEPFDAPAVAEIVATDVAQWLDAAERFGAGSSVSSGRTLRLESGRAELAFANGAHVVLEGPAILRPQTAASAVLESGRLVALVPPRARGFTVVTPTATVFDLGTEFGVSVDGARVVEVHVFEGAVELTTRDEVGQPAFRQRLAGGQAKRMPARDPGTWSDVPVRPLGFPRSSVLAAAPREVPELREPVELPPAAPLALSDDGDWRTLLHETFAGPPLDAARWMVVPPLPVADIAAAQVREPGVRVLNEQVELINGALLTTTGSFNPHRLGPIRVQATWDVVEPEDELRVFVRTGTSDPDDHVPLRYGVACTFGTWFPSVGTTMGIVATDRDESINEFDFLACPAPEPGERYHVVVIDDGREVVFTVRHDAEGGWTQTVTLRTSDTLPAREESRVAFSNRGVMPMQDLRTRLSNVRIERYQPADSPRGATRKESE